MDCTFGRGGHSRAILERLNDQGRVLAVDQDPDAVAAGQSLCAADQRLSLKHAPFTELTQHLQILGWLGKVKGIVLDLGISSPQVDQPKRGFSFLREGPLDMRMNPQRGEPAANWLNRASAQEIAEIFFRYGEERHALRLAKAIVAARRLAPLSTTTQLAQIITAAHPSWPKDKHPATQVFQAIRLFVNQELENLQTVLPQTISALAPGGRLAVISFHSLEDRIVKRFIREQKQGDPFPLRLPVTTAQLQPTLQPVGKPIYPSAAEIQRNPRARSAVLRVAERIVKV